MTKNSKTTVDQTSTISARVLQAAYSHYGNTAYVSSGDGKVTPQNIKRVFAAALLSTASVVAVGAATSTSAMAGICNQTGQTVNCAGSFTDTIDYDVVGDLTVVVGGGAVIDTTSNYSDYAGDNAGVVVYSGGNATIRNNGTILTDTDGFYAAEDGQYHNHGIFAYSDGGSATVDNKTTGFIITYGPRSYGAYANAYYGPTTATNSGTISTHGAFSDGLVAHSSGQEYSEDNAVATNNAGAYVFTDGDNADGIVAISDGSWEGTATATNNGEVGVYGDSVAAITASADDAYAYNNGTVMVGSASDEASFSVGVYARTNYDESAYALNSEDASITMYGNEDVGVMASGGSAEAVNDGSITIHGNYGAGVVATGDDADGANTGSVTAYGYASVGVHADGKYANAHNDVSGAISLYGDASHGLESDGFDSTATNAGNIYIDGGVGTEGTFNAATWLSNYGPDVQNGDGYDASEYLTIGVAATGTFATATNQAASEDYMGSGSITVTGESAIGLTASGAKYAHAVNDGSITTGGTEDGFANFGAVAFSFLGEAKVDNSGSIDTYGNLSMGALAMASENATALNYAGGSITTHDAWNGEDYSSFGAVGLGAFSSSEDAVAINGALPEVEPRISEDLPATATIVTHGDAAFGLVAVSVTGGSYNSEDESWSGGAYAHNTAYGSVTTYGDLAIGVLASTTSDKYALAVNDGSVTTHGYGAFGVAALGGGVGVTYATEDGVVEAVFDPIVNGSLANVPPYSNEYSGLVYAVNSEDGTIVTHGVAGAGVYAAAIYADAVGVNRGSVTTSEDLGAGVVAASVFGTATAANLYNGSIVTHGDDAVGVIAFSGNTIAGYGANITSEDGDGAYAINSGINKYNNGPISEDYGTATIRTYGNDAVGVLAQAYHSSAWALNVHGDVTTGTAIVPDAPVSTGDGASGVMARAFDGSAFASNKYYGDVTTYGDDAYGVAAFAEGVGSDATAINAKYSTVETYGDGSTGVLAVSEDHATAANFIGSDVTTHGDYAGGVVAFSYDGDATAVNGTYYGYYLNSRKYASYAPSTITTYGEDSVGLSATTDNGDAVAINGDGSSITTHGDNSNGLVASAQYGTAYAVNGFHQFTEDGDGSTSSITTFGDNSYGILVTSNGVTLNSEDSNVGAYNYGSITTSGIDSDGIHAYSEDGKVTVVNASTGEITTGASQIEQLNISEDPGYRAFGIYAWSLNGDVEITNDGSVTTNGEDAIGIYGWTTNGGAITITNSEDASVTTYGDGATGIFAYAESSGAVDITNDGSVETYGDNADGIYAYANGSGVTVYNTGSITTGGEDSIGISIHNTGEGDTHVTNTSTGEITTSGAGADGIDVNSDEDGDVFVTNDGTITVTGEDAIGIDVYSYYAATVINTGTVSSEGIAINIYSGYGDDSGGPSILRNEDGGDITGDVHVGAYYDAKFYNSDSTITGAVYLSSNEGEIFASIYGSGNDITKGIHATGSGRLDFNQTDTMTFADGVEGDAISGFDNINFYNGTTVFDNGGSEDSVVDISMNEGGQIFIGGSYNVESEDWTTAQVTFKGGNASTINVYADNTTVEYNGTISVDTGTTVDFSGDVAFTENSTFRTQLSNDGAGVIGGNTVYFGEDTSIYVDVPGSINAIVGDDILIAYAHSEDGVTDRGATVTDNSILFKFEKIMNGDVVDNAGTGEAYSADEEYLRVLIDETAVGVTDDTEGNTENEDSMAAAIDEYIRTHPTDDPLVQFLSQFDTPEEQRAALYKLVQDSLPDQSNGGVDGTIGASDLVFDMILDRLANGGFFVAANDTQSGVSAGDMALGGDGHWALWGRAGLLKAEYTPSAVPGFDAKTWGISVGIDGNVAENVRVGLAYMYQDAKIDENGVGANSNTDITGNGIIGYMSYTPDPYFLNTALSYTWNNYNGKRFTGLGTNTSDYNGSQVAARAELGRVFKEGSFDLTPSVGLRYNYVSQDEYTETGLLALHVNERNETSVRGTLGLNAKYNMELSGGGKLIPEASVSLINEFADPSGALSGNVVGGGAFVTNQTARKDLSYGLGAGLTYKATDSLSVGIHYQGEFQSDYSQNAGEFNVRLAF